MEPGCVNQGITQAKGVSQLPSQGQGLLNSRQGLVRITKQQPASSHKAEACHLGVYRETGDKGIVLLWIVESNALLQVILGQGQFSQEEQDPPQLTVCLYEVMGILLPLGQAQELLCQRTCCL